MSAPFGSADWANALKREINDSSEYRNAAAGWGVGFNGNMLFVFEADEESDESRALMLNLAQGNCDSAEFLSADSHPDAGFVLRGPFSLWRDILERKTMAATAILTGNLKVEGERMQLLKHTAANRALIHCTASVDTDFPG